MKQLIAGLLSFFLLVSFSIPSAKPTQKKYEKKFKTDCIPADLKKEGFILLVQSPFSEKEETKNAEIQNLFETHYNGKFIVVPAGAANNRYADKNIYKYSISILQTSKTKDVEMGNNVVKRVSYDYYKLSIIDGLKLNKNKIDPQIIKDKLKKEGKKKPTLEDYKRELNLDDFDTTAIKETGLEDRVKDLNDMLKFLAIKLGEAN